MKKLLLSFTFLFLLINISSAQVAVFKSTSFVDSISQPGLKKYGVKLSCTGINLPIVFVTTDQQSGIVYYGDSIPNLLNSNNTPTQMFLANYISCAINANNCTDTLMSTQPAPMSKNILSISLVSSPTSVLSCDGKIHQNVNTSDPSISNISLRFGKPWGGMPGLLISPYNVDTLCEGKYFSMLMYNRELTPGNVVYLTEDVSFLIGQSAFPSSTGLNVQVNPYKQANAPACDGKARVSITNSVVPFLCSFDGGAFTSVDSLTNLCEGMHRVVVATSNDTVGKYFIIANNNNVINNPNPYSSVIDTIIYNFTNCNFNYNLPIDSAFIVNYNVIDTNTIFVSWNIWQGGALTSVSDTISYLYQSGTSMVSLMIFCGNAKTANTASFRTFRVNDYVLLNQTVGIKENKKEELNIELFPNPFSVYISIKSSSVTDIKQIEVFNLIGELMDINYHMNSNEIVLNTENLKSGYYTISVISKSGQRHSFKVVKH